MSGDVVLEARNVDITFTARRRLGRAAAPPVHAVIDASLDIAHGETLGLVGESGSGKTTLGRAILGLLPPNGGTITVEGSAMSDRIEPDLRRRVQAVFQDPFGSLNPAWTVGDLIAEPMRNRRPPVNAADRAAKVDELLAAVGLDPSHAGRFPAEFSGGQRQRIAIARALASEPSLIVLDEPVSALDVSTRAQVINLLEDLQARTGVAYLFIGHDLAVVRHTSQRIAVMYRGRIVEIGRADRICDRPAHPYTALLLASVPEADPEKQSRRRDERRRLSSAATIASVAAGCPFAPRCPFAVDACHERFPDPTPLDDGWVACHRVGEITLVGAASAAAEPTSTEAD